MMIYNCWGEHMLYSLFLQVIMANFNTPHAIYFIRSGCIYDQLYLAIIKSKINVNPEEEMHCL